MNKREFLRLTSLAGAAVLSAPLSSLATTGFSPKPFLADPKAPFVLPALPYAFDALEPNIDRQTMEIHHDKHHAAYVKNLNDAVNGTTFASLTLEQILRRITYKDNAIRNNGGGHYNHSLFWTLLSPNKTNPSDKLKGLISKAFGSWEQFQQQFNDAAKTQFGSGWAWLIVTPGKKLAVINTPNQDNPLMQNIVKQRGTPILALDVWEHAYYLKYQNKRPDYINAFWNVINWDEVEKRYNAAIV
ncbi:superoxide dismutase [Chitinophaga nivalis]|uniref:Superoxide dismutase n=1 Tax=Chitinophaga nivalis TaxID=2991709 RepID=A0ABT3IWW6_9BACT|nr:superoxide dismutase [Chitinophaga nivalis]MCW3461849.1 superoxide dismutase [Chitinophaga nivalis]MCW3488457.1 superoxide dismutase [Chitinophaga nivalis]